MCLSFAKFSIGQIVRNHLFDYRGVIVDVDPRFLGTEEWYQSAAKTNPPKAEPWYHILVDGSDSKTYVAEKNLELDVSGKPVNHPDINDYFKAQHNEGYVLKSKNN